MTRWMISIPLLLVACPDVATTRTLSDGSATTRFGSDLPSLVEEVFDTCHGEAGFYANSLSSSLNLAGDCQDFTSSEYAALSTDGKLLAVAASTRDELDTRTPMTNVDLSDAADVYVAYGNITWGEWEPATVLDHECSIVLDWRDLDVDSLVIESIDARWSSAAWFGPSLQVVAAFDDDAALASGDLGFLLDCDAIRHEWAVGSWMPDSTTYELRPRGLRVNLVFEPTVNSLGDLTWKVHSWGSMDGLEPYPAFPAKFEERVGTLEDLMAVYGGRSVDDIADLVAAEVGDASSPFTVGLDTIFEDEIPSGHKFCSLSHVRSSVLVASDTSCLGELSY